MLKDYYSTTEKYLSNGPGLPAALFLIALGIRIPWLWEIPRYIDELKEVNLAYQIYLGNSFPLHNMAPEIGALHNYILAGIFRVCGPSIYWPRLYVAIISALTVVLVYYLGKELYNHWTGLLAAGLLLTNGMHILVTHMAWANCTTPFFLIVSLIAVAKAEGYAEPLKGKWLVIAGFLWSLTLQTHSSVIIYLLATTIYLFRPKVRRKIAAKYFCYGGLAFIIGYANMIYYNLISRGGSIGWIFVKKYTLESNPGLKSFSCNFMAMVIELFRAVSTTYTFHKSLWGYMSQPFFSICLLLFIVGTYFSVKHQKVLLIWLIAAGLMIIPWINRRYDFFIATRYIMPVIIGSILVMAYGITNLLKAIDLKLSKKQTALWSLLWLGLFLLFGGRQLILFYNYCNNLADTDMSNRLALQLFTRIDRVARANQTIVLLDNKVKIENDPLPYLLIMSKHHYSIIRMPAHNQNEIGGWLRVIKKYPRDQLLGVMALQTYQQLRKAVSLKKFNLFICRLVLNKPLDSQVFNAIYLIKINPPKP